MAHFAVLCPEISGHLNPMTTLTRALEARGHTFTWICTEDGSRHPLLQRFDTVAIGQEHVPLGTLERSNRMAGKLTGLAAARHAIGQYRNAMRGLLEEGPDAIRACGAAALLADESVFASRTIAELLDLPWITVCNALPMHPDPDHPPMMKTWSYGQSWLSRMRNYAGKCAGGAVMHSIGREISLARKHNGLSQYDWMSENISNRLTLAQIPAELDYPRSSKPDSFHYVGGLQPDEHRQRKVDDFPYDRLDGRPLIYASLGTIQNRVLRVFRCIAAACLDLPAQLVVSMGGGETPSALGKLPGDPLIVPFAPQLELISRARMVVTHAGMNTTMESLAHGVPMVAIPITNDQPGVAARIARSGCGEFIPLHRLTVKRLASKLQQVFEDETYTTRAKEMAVANRRAGGVTRAVKLIEQSVGQAEEIAVT